MALIPITILLGSCKPAPGEAYSSSSEAGSSEIVTVSEAFITESDTLDNIDSVTMWHGPDGEHWLLATAKETDLVRVYDGATGTALQRIGGEGKDLGYLDRPNGIAAVDDLMIVVERDNARIQIFRLPDFTPIGAIGEEELKRPYGLSVFSQQPGQYTLYVTDNYELEEDVIPPPGELGERVRHYEFSVLGDVLSSNHIRAFGETSGEGVLQVVESIMADPASDRLMVAEELEVASHHKVYTLDGKFTGSIMGRGYFPNQAEGIVLYACEDEGGYWVTTDQADLRSTFLIFDRNSLEHLGSFQGEITGNTDGIALTQAAFGPFSNGALYAVHNDQGVAAFSWGDIAQALQLRTDCTKTIE